MNDVTMMDHHNIADNDGYFPHVDSINSMDVDDDEWVERDEEKISWLTNLKKRLKRNDDDDGDGDPAATQEQRLQTQAPPRALDITELVRSRDEAAGIDTALRVMALAGRILWKAAVDSLPAEGGYSFHVLSKLFRKSYFRNSGSGSDSNQQQEHAMLEGGAEEEKEDANAAVAALTRDFIIGDGADGGSTGNDINGNADDSNRGSNRKRKQREQSRSRSSPSFVPSVLLPVVTAMQPRPSEKRRRVVEISEEEEECYPLSCYEQRQQNPHRHPMKRIKLC